MTEAELKLWSRLRRKQLLGVQVYRQRPIGPYVVDFYAPRAKLIVAVDGAQHLTSEGMASDTRRDDYLAEHGLLIKRFNNLQVLQETEAVVTVIYAALQRVGGTT